MNDVLLTVSGNIPADIRDQIAAKQRPHTDYIAMADAFEADLIGYGEAAAAAGWFGRLLQRFGGNNLLLAWICFLKRHQYKVIFTDGEQVGLPLALFFRFLAWGKRPQHLMIVHILSVGKKVRLIDVFGLEKCIDLFLVYATWQQEYIRERWKLPAERVVFTPFMVDSHFFSKEQVDGDEPITGFDASHKPMVCGVGLEFRDYPTLLKAVDGLDMHVVIAAGSPWSKRSDSTDGQYIPKNVTVRRFTQYELRQIYNWSDLLVMPLYDVEFQAGVTALLEAMSMNLAVVCSKTKGQTDVVEDGRSGIYVEPGDVEGLRNALVSLLSDESKRIAMGQRGREIIDEYMSLDHYVVRLNDYVKKAKEMV